MMETEDFIKIFRRAIALVDGGFYDRSEWSNVNYAQKDKVKNRIIRFGERAFCYELYYHCRALIEQCYPELQTSRKVWLQAELKKSQITDLIAKENDVTRLDAESCC